MVTVRFSNETDLPVDFMVEPWGAVEPMPPNAHWAIHYSPPAERDDTSHAEYHVGMIRFWVAGDTYEIDVNGVQIVT